jgi:hypothetical protein
MLFLLVFPEEKSSMLSILFITKDIMNKSSDSAIGFALMVIAFCYRDGLRGSYRSKLILKGSAPDRKPRMAVQFMFGQYENCSTRPLGTEIDSSGNLVLGRTGFDRRKVTVRKILLSPEP